MSHNSIESFYRSFLSKPVESTSTPPFYIYVDKTPLNNSGTLSGFITLSPNTKSEEIMEYDLVDSNSKSIRITKRGIKPNATSLTTNGVDYNNTLYKFSHSPQDEVRQDLNHLHILEKMDASADNTLSGNNTFSGTSTFNGGVEFNSELNIPTFANTTARDTVYTSPVEGDKAVVTGIGEQIYLGGAWQTLGISTPTPDATTTVSGKVEIGTQAEVDNGSDIGGTGATNVVVPSTFQAGVNAKIASTSEVTTGTIDNKFVTPLKLSERLTALKASNSDVVTGTDTNKYVTPAQVNGVILPSDTIIATSNGESSVDFVYTKYKEAVCNKTGTYRITAVLSGRMSSSGSATLFATLYKNGVSYSSEQSHNFSGQATIQSGTVGWDISYSQGDLIQLYVKLVNLSSTANYNTVKDFKIKGDYFPSILVPTINL